MKAKQRMTCAYDLCAHGKVIRPGEEITWNRKSAGQRYHVDCFVAAKGMSEYAPLQREHEGKAVATKFTTIEELELALDEAIEIAEETKELRHYLYPLLKYYVGIRQHVYLYSAPGSGKSHVARQVAKELKLEFSYISVNPQSPASLLLGYMDANGVYRESELFKRWRDGGIFLFDEQDNCSSSLLTILNGMLALSGRPEECLANFPCGMVPKHPDFIFIGTGNTTGRGGDWQFPERRKIDEASIDRLVFIQWAYDEALELSLTLAINSNASGWVRWIQTVRAYTNRKENGIKGGIYCTPRSSMSGAKELKQLGKPFFSIQEIAARNVFKGADVDTINRILAACPLPR